tara:strand:+ start:2242 stop:2463 length:222 start_codon:yes stop_codon:yes gene_type:complete
MESKRRSIVKALSWRVVAVLITATVALRITGELAIAIEIGLLDTLIKLFIYYGHERLWLKIPYGKLPPTDYQI